MQASEGPRCAHYERIAEPPVEPVNVERDRSGAPQPAEHDEKREPREEQELQLRYYVEAGVVHILDGIRVGLANGLISGTQALYAEERAEVLRAAKEDPT